MQWKGFSSQVNSFIMETKATPSYPTLFSKELLQPKNVFCPNSITPYNKSKIINLLYGRKKV